MRLRFVRPLLHELDALEAEALACVVWEDVRPFNGVAGLCDWRFGGRLSELFADGFVSAEPGAVTLVAGRPRTAFEKILLVGGGRLEEFDESRFERALASLLAALEGLMCRSVAVELPGRASDRIPPERATEQLLAAITTPLARSMTWTLVESSDAQHRIEHHVVEERRRLRPAP